MTASRASRIRGAKIEGTELPNKARREEEAATKAAEAGRWQIDESSRSIRDAAGLLADFRPNHGLRHTFASHLASSGEVDLYTLQRLMTHKSPIMTQRYGTYGMRR